MNSFYKIICLLTKENKCTTSVFLKPDLDKVQK